MKILIVFLFCCHFFVYSQQELTGTTPSSNWTMPESNIPKPVLNDAPPQITMDPKQVTPLPTDVTNINIFINMNKPDPKSQEKINAENNEVRKAFKKSATRAAFGYALAALGATVTGLAAVEVKKIKARIAKIKELKEALDPVAGGLVCATQDYENKSKLGCYCMTADGTPNQSRDPKGVCSAYLGNGKLAPKGRNYSLGQVASTNNSAGCMTQSYIYDPSCYCKKSGSCMKISTGANNIGGLSSLVGQMVGGANDIFKGNTGSGNFNAGTYMNGAARLSKLKDKILDAPQYKDLGNQIKKMEDYYMKSEQQKAGGTGSQSYDAVNPVAQALSGVLPDSAKKEMDSLYAQDKKSKYQGFSGAGKVAGKDDPFDFSLPGGNQALNDTEVLSMMDQNYAYDKADIAAPSGASLFDILSLRYQKSAQGRLFAK